MTNEGPDPYQNRTVPAPLPGDSEAVSTRHLQSRPGRARRRSPTTRPCNWHTVAEARLMRALIEQLLLPQFGRQPVNGTLWRPPHDSAVFELGGARLAFTTDSFVVSPLFFPGGDVGKLAVYGTVNRSGHVRRDSALPELRPDPGRRHAAGDPAPRGGVHAAGGGRSRCADVTGDTKVVDRGRVTGFHQHRWRGAGPGRHRHLAGAGQPRRPDPDQRRHRAAWDCDHVGSVRVCNSRAPWRVTARRWPAWWPN